MKRFLAVVLLTALPFFSEAAQSATAKLVCESVRLQRGVDASTQNTLDLSSYSLPDPPANGELKVDPGSTYSHLAYFAINNPAGDTLLSGTLYLSIPSVTDTNTGMNSFLEVSQAISATSAGQYQSTDSGEFVATWSRKANSATGTCTFDFGSHGVFTQQFSIVEYTGPLSYVPGSSVVLGSIAFTNSVDATQWLTGSVQFVKSDSNPADLLDLQPVSWTNAAGADFTIFAAAPIYRDTEVGTNYFGWLWVMDGDPSTPVLDYQNWFLYFTDRNDANTNGIPDFSDAPEKVLMLTVELGADTALLTVSGVAAGATCTIMESTDLATTNWAPVRTFPVSGASQSVLMPFSPTNAPRFWRALVQ